MVAVTSSSNSKKSRREKGSFVSKKAETEESVSKLEDKVIFINRCAKVVKGGRRFSFAALVAVGDRAGRVGIGLGKAKETPDAVKKAVERAKKGMRRYSILGRTLPHEAHGHSDGGEVVLLPAAPGTGVVAGGGVRLILELLGVSDVLSKSIGSNNPFAMVKATLNALEKLRTYSDVMSLRGSEGDKE